MQVFYAINLPCFGQRQMIIFSTTKCAHFFLARKLQGKPTRKNVVKYEEQRWSYDIVCFLTRLNSFQGFFYLWRRVKPKVSYRYKNLCELTLARNIVCWCVQFAEPFAFARTNWDNEKHAAVDIGLEPRTNLGAHKDDRRGSLSVLVSTRSHICTTRRMQGRSWWKVETNPSRRQKRQALEQNDGRKKCKQ